MPDYERLAKLAMDQVVSSLRLRGGDTDFGALTAADRLFAMEEYVRRAYHHMAESGNGYDPTIHATATAEDIAIEFAKMQAIGESPIGSRRITEKIRLWLRAAAAGM